VLYVQVVQNEDAVDFVADNIAVDLGWVFVVAGDDGFSDFEDALDDFVVLGKVESAGNVFGGVRASVGFKPGVEDEIDIFLTGWSKADFGGWFGHFLLLVAYANFLYSCLGFARTLYLWLDVLALSLLIITRLVLR